MSAFADPGIGAEEDTSASTIDVKASIVVRVYPGTVTRVKRMTLEDWGRVSRLLERSTRAIDQALAHVEITHMILDDDDA